MRLFLCLFVVFFIGLFSFIGFVEQEVEGNINSLTCEEIRECILLDIACMESAITNDLFGKTWGFKTKYISDQSKYYIIECLNNDVFGEQDA